MMKLQFIKFLSYLRLAGLLLVTGCASNTVNLQVVSEVPAPVVQRIPLTMGIYYDDKFRNYVFKENSEDRENWMIDNRVSRLALFLGILEAMFNQVKPITDPNDNAVVSAVDAIMTPEVLDMQVSLPRETLTDSYEAWIKYTIRLYQPKGNLISEWPVTGYGKASTELFKSKEKGLNTAINQALRDIGAKIALTYTKHPDVYDWLVTKINCSEYSALC